MSTPVKARRAGAALLAACASACVAATHEPPSFPLPARLVASGLPDAHGLRPVGRFHAGGPFTSNPEFLLQTQAGRMLDPERVLVAVSGNLGAEPADASQHGGAVLSIATDGAGEGHPLRVAPDLARHPPAAGAPVQLYTAQSTRYLNRTHNAGARTAAFTAAAGPRYLSVNNAFGRPWIANAPYGLQGAGSETVVDPDGAPLANAPSAAAGGVFVGDRTPRTSVPTSVRSGWFDMLWNRRDSGQLTPGALARGAYGTALLGASPDGTGFAVFAVVTGDGAVAQVHVQDGVDGLAPPGTVAVDGLDPGVIGIAFKWTPGRALFVADARRNRVVVLALGDDGRHFTLAGRTALASPWLAEPVDLAPAMPEIANPRFSSLTTLAGGSDLYVANRGDGSIVRLAQDGRVVARALLRWPDGRPLGGGRLRAIAVASDGLRLWAIAQQGPGDDCALLQLDAFDAEGPQSPVAAPPLAATVRPDDGADAAHGARLFATRFTAATGLGERFNADSCLACHPGGDGASTDEAHFARRAARLDPRTGRLLPLEGLDSVLAPRRRLAGQAVVDSPPPRGANVVSLRMPLALAAAGRLDEIPDAAIEAQAVSKGDGIKGRVQRVTMPDGSTRAGRYGWKADVATLDAMVADAFTGELGLASAPAAHPRLPALDDGRLAHAVAAFLRARAGSASPLETVAARVAAPIALREEAAR